MIKKRRGLCLIIALCLLIVMASFISGCKKPAFYDGDGYNNEGQNTWALIKVGGGEPLHVQVERWVVSNGTMHIYTKDQMFVTSSVNVLIIEDLK
jgi:type II secretory pathway component PulK